MKHFIVFLVIIAFLTGCTTTVSSDEKEKAPSDISAIQNSSITVAEDNKQTDNTEAPVIGGDSSRRVESVGESYRDLENMSIQNRSKLETFDIELCYFKMKNIPEEYDEVYASIWEIGFFADFENPKTKERIEFNWWANVTTEKYLEEIKKVRNLKIVTKNEIEYYCSFVIMGDGKVGETPYHAAIRWIEDDRCFYIQILSATPLDESVLKYCEIEKFTID